MATAPDLALDPVNAWPVEPKLEPELNESELVAALRREYDAAESEWERLREIQTAAWKYYEAKPFGNEEPGRSQIILPDVQETADFMATSVLNPFVSGDRVVEFEATDEGDEEAVDEATAALNYNFMRRQDGYRMLHDWCVSGLMERYGVAKAMMVTEERVSRERRQITDPVELEGIDAEIEDASDNQDGTITVTLKREVREKRFVTVSVPAYEFRFSPYARHEDEADYLAHCPVKTRSDLVDMGFDREQVYSLPNYTHALDYREQPETWKEVESTPALELVQLCEEYARIDVDGDGIAERVKVFRVENEILRWADGSLALETVDEQPFAIFCPYPRPHRLAGWSLADKVMDIQLARSTIARQLMDGMYNANMPRPIVSESGSGDYTMDDILSPIPGSPIRVRDASAILPFQTSFDVGKSLSVLSWMTEERESRTSITRLNKGIDKDALNDTASGQNQLMSAGALNQEFVSRNLGEALARLQAKTYRLMRNEADPFKVKVDGQYKLVNPAMWPEDINLVIRVGLGTGSKDKRIQARLTLAPIMAEGFQNGQVKPKHLFHAVDGLVRDLGIGQGDDYWVDPDSPEAQQEAQQQPEKPDPEMAKVQADAQVQQQKLQLEGQKAQGQIELAQAESAAKIQLMREESAAKLEAQHQKDAYEASANERRMEFEQAMALRAADFNERLAERKAEREAAQAETISANRPGGDLDK